MKNLDSLLHFVSENTKFPLSSGRSLCCPDRGWIVGISDLNATKETEGLDIHVAKYVVMAANNFPKLVEALESQDLNQTIELLNSIKQEVKDILGED